MKVTHKLGNIVAAALTVPERMLLFCIARGTDWQKAGITSETVTLMVVKGLVERDAEVRLTLLDQGREVLAGLLRWQ